MTLLLILVAIVLSSVLVFVQIRVEMGQVRKVKIGGARDELFLGQNGVNVVVYRGHCEVNLYVYVYLERFMKERNESRVEAKEKQRMRRKGMVRMEGDGRNESRALFPQTNSRNREWLDRRRDCSSNLFLYHFNVIVRSMPAWGCAD